MSHTAEIVSVGTELLLGNVANTDARDISQVLSELGINVFYHTVVGDNPQRLKDAIAIAKKRADIIITTGGLGPTFDDLTKQTLAEAFGKTLIFDEEEAKAIRSYFTEKLHANNWTENNLQQAMLPEGCTVFHNRCGTAPGCAFFADGVHVLMLPGPPRECIDMFTHSAVPYLKKLSDSEILSHNIRIFGMGESQVEDILRPMMESLTNPTLAPYAKPGEVMLRVTAKAASRDEAEDLMGPVIADVQKILGDVIYGIDTDSLEETVLGLLLKQGLTLSTAESCTAGLVAKRITDLSGSSATFPGGLVTYSNRLKNQLLGIPMELLEDKGAVSEEVARLMAQKVREILNTDLGIGVTGVAGPNSDEKGTPVGTVYVSLASKDQVFCRKLHLGTSRERVRHLASSYALDMIRRYITGKNPQE